MLCKSSVWSVIGVCVLILPFMVVPDMIMYRHTMILAPVFCLCLVFKGFEGKGGSR